ncbi:AAA family ATPase [Nonomuraea wenchangensis]|uniref:AAA family ATPase n=1 Tax=Nonomuraea wenchangensis TaxID=568860 RepID=UPI00384BB741
MTQHHPERQHLSAPAQELVEALFGPTDESDELPPWPSEIPDQLEAQVQALMGELLDSDALDDIPALEPLVADVLFLDTVTRLHGPSGTFKSFLTLSLAGAVGTGTPWHGRAVKQGTAVYIVAEGIKGMRKRVRAWEQHHGVLMTGVRFLPRPVQIKSPEWVALIEVCRRLEAVLIIIDTQARSTVGVNENDNTEMGVILDLMERMRTATGACVLTVHHTGHENTERGRGASAMKGGMQTELSVSRKGKEFADTRITLDMPKQKDDEEQPVGTFRPFRVQLDGEAKEDGTPITSVVLIPDTEEYAETGAGNWLVQKLDLEGVPEDLSNSQTREVLRALKIKAGNEVIAEAVRVRKSRTNVRSGTAGNGEQPAPFPAQRNGNAITPGQPVPGTVPEQSGTASPHDRSAFPVLKDGERSGAPPKEMGKDGPIGLCDVCCQTLTIKGGMTRHPGCAPR